MPWRRPQRRRSRSSRGGSMAAWDHTTDFAVVGGVVWLPNNPLMQRDGVDDSDEEALAYFEDVVGDVGPASSPERRRTYVREGQAMVRFLEDLGVEFLRCEGYSDYYS